MTGFDENKNVESIRIKQQPIKADEIKRALGIGYHLKCIRCGSTYYHTEFAMAEMSYRMYSYCPNCIDEGINALKEKDKQKKEKCVPIDRLADFMAKNYEPLYKLEDVSKLKWPIDYEQQKQAWMNILEDLSHD